MFKAAYSIYDLLLTTAGSETVHGAWGVIRVLDAVDGSGTVQPNVKITVRAGADADAVPLRLGQAFLAQGGDRPDEWVIEWAAQSGITATIGFSQDARLVDWDADPAAQILGGAVSLSQSSAIVTTADVSITGAAAAAVVKAANTARREILIGNLAANASVIRVGDSSTGASRGQEVSPGQTLTLSTEAAVYVYSPTTQSVSVIEVED